MIKQDILNQVAGNAIAPLPVIDLWVTRALNYSGEEPSRLICSYKASSSGIAISSIFLVGEKYVVEVRINHEPSFDVVLKNGIRFALDSAQISFDDSSGAPRRVNGVRAEIFHSLELSSEMWHFGDNLDEWLENLYSAFPPTMLK